MSLPVRLKSTSFNDSSNVFSQFLPKCPEFFYWTDHRVIENIIRNAHDGSWQNIGGVCGWKPLVLTPSSWIYFIKRWLWDKYTIELNAGLWESHKRLTVSQLLDRAVFCSKQHVPGHFRSSLTWHMSHMYRFTHYIWLERSLSKCKGLKDMSSDRSEVVSSPLTDHLPSFPPDAKVPKSSKKKQKKTLHCLFLAAHLQI